MQLKIKKTFRDIFGQLHTRECKATKKEIVRLSSEIWRGGSVVQGQGGGRTLDLDGQGGWKVLKIGQFLWTSYVYHP